MSDDAEQLLEATGIASGSAAVVLAPHLDDAVLSCGGTMHRLVGAGVGVTAVTVYTADPDPATPLSPLAARHHRSWGTGDAPFVSRREEDLAAASRFGFRAVHLGLHDALYRRDAAGRPFYAEEIVEVPVAPAP